MPRLKRTYLRPEDRGLDALVQFVGKNTGKYYRRTQADLAEELGVTKQTFSHRMTKKHQFTHSELCRLFQLLKPTDEEILSFFGREPKKSSKSA